MKSGQANWFAVVSKPRQELTAYEDLQHQGIECFLPMAENPCQRRNKKTKKELNP